MTPLLVAPKDLVQKQNLTKIEEKKNPQKLKEKRPKKTQNEIKKTRERKKNDPLTPYSLPQKPEIETEIQKPSPKI